MNRTVRMEIARVERPGDPLPLPRYMTPGAAGLDLCADIVEPVTLAPGTRALVPTGLRIAVPEGFEAQIRPRSGLALKHGLSIPNAPGTIDSDYRGEVQVLLINLGQEPFVVKRGERRTRGGSEPRRHRPRRGRLRLHRSRLTTSTQRASVW